MSAIKRILQTAKDLFVPNEGNGLVPRVLSNTGISAYLMVALFLLLVPSFARVSQLASITASTETTAERLVELANIARAATGLSTLKPNTMLQNAAEAKLDDIFAKQYFAHISPDGTTPWSFIRNAGYQYSAAGENLAQDFAGADDAHVAFMKSPTHKANILSPLYSEIGVAMRRGMFEGRTSTLIVEYFGKPKPLLSASVTTGAQNSTTSASNTTTTSPTAGATSESPEQQNAVTQNTGSSQVAGSTVRETPFTIPNYLKIKIAAMILAASLAIALLFYWSRTNTVSLHIAARTLAVVLILSFAATSVREWDTARIPPSADATVSLGQE